MQVFFITLSITFATYFLFFRKKVDYFLIAYLSCLVYFMPGFFGYVGYSYMRAWEEEKILPEVYLVFISVMVSVFLFSILGDLLNRRKGMPEVGKEKLGVELYSLAILSGFGLAVTLYLSGVSLFDADKNNVMDGLGRWYIIYYAASTVGLPVSVLARRNRFSLFFVILLCFNMYMGFRSSLAIAFISSSLIYFSRFQGSYKRVLLSSFGLILLGFFLFLYKQIAAAIKAGMWDLAIERVLSWDTYVVMVVNSEPFVTQAILNGVISNDFHTEMNHVYAAIYQITFFASYLGAEISSFNDHFQMSIFGDVGYGMASNIWAQMWSAGGWPLLLMMVVLFNIVLLIGNRTLRMRNAALSAALSPVFCYWAFYIHRNDLSYIINLEKRMLVIVLICFCMGVVLRKIASKESGR